MRRRKKRQPRRYCYKCGMELNPDYGEKMMCLDCAWWAEQAAKNKKEQSHG